MKKILIVGVSSIVGGIETLFYGLFGEKSRAFDITFLCFDKPCAFADAYISQGYKVDVIPSRKSNPILFSRNIKRYIRTHCEFDYVWVNTSSTSMYQIQMYSKKYTKSKVITHSHGTKFERTGNWLFHLGNKILHRLNYKKVISNTDLFFCCSRAAGVALFGENNADRLIVINNGIDCDRFGYSEDFRVEIREEFGIRNDEFLIGLIGRLSPQKNPVRAVEIFKQVLETKSNSKLLIVGTGDLLLEVKEKINDLNMSDNVVIAGLRRDVNKIYSALDALIMPSIFEGLPLTAIEAQCAGLNCILSDKITKEAGITDCSHFVALDDSNELWADTIINAVCVSDRIWYCNSVKDRGYDYLKVKETIESILI